MDERGARPAPITLFEASKPPATPIRRGAGSMLSIPIGNIAGDFRAVSLNRRRRSATYELMVANETNGPLATFTYAVTRTRPGRRDDLERDHRSGALIDRRDRRLRAAQTRPAPAGRGGTPLHRRPPDAGGRSAQSSSARDRAKLRDRRDGSAVAFARAPALTPPAARKSSRSPRRPKSPAVNRSRWRMRSDRSAVPNTPSKLRTASRSATASCPRARAPSLSTCRPRP